MARKTSTKKKNKFDFLKIRIKQFILPLIVVAVFLALGFLKNQFVAATVNGKQISRIELTRELEKKEGKRILDNLITETLILEAAEKKKIAVNDAEVDSEIKKLEKNLSGQGQNLDDLLVAQNFTRAELKKQVKMQLIVKKLVGEVKVIDKEVDDYLEQNKDSIPEDTNKEELKTSIKEQLIQQKTNDKIQLILSELQKKAKIEYLLKF